VAEPLDTLKLSFRPAQFDEDETAFNSRLAVYVGDATSRTASITDATNLATAQLAWARYRAYSDMLEVVRDRLTSTQNEGEGQVSFTDVGSRLKDIREARDEALGEFQAAAAETGAAEVRGSRSIPLVVEW
jgi:gamma-glutamyl:cysteine ligase YbdK (ATP-grasp superfamily)